FSHVWRGYQYRWFTHDAKFGDGACTGPGDDQVGRRISQIHTLEKSSQFHGAFIFRTQSIAQRIVVITATLPDHLHISGSQAIESFEHTVIQRACTKATTGE